VRAIFMEGNNPVREVVVKVKDKIISVASYLIRLASWQSSTRSRIPNNQNTSTSGISKPRIPNHNTSSRCSIPTPFK
jgi:hypothetical protein